MELEKSDKTVDEVKRQQRKSKVKELLDEFMKRPEKIVKVSMDNKDKLMSAYMSMKRFIKLGGLSIEVKLNNNEIYLMKGPKKDAKGAAINE